MNCGQKCFFCLNLELGCILLGVTGFITYLALAVTAGMNLILALKNEFINELSDSERVQKAMLVTVVAVALIRVFPNLLLVVGVVKKRPGFLLFYFGSGIFFEIFIMICALLFLLYNQWIKALVISLIFLIYIRCLMMVYSVYESMLQQNLHRTTSQVLLVEDAIASDASQETITADTF